MNFPLGLLIIVTDHDTHTDAYTGSGRIHVGVVWFSMTI